MPQNHTTAQLPDMDTTLNWTCDQCRFPIADGEGFLAVDERAACTYPERDIAWQAEVLANDAQTVARGITTVPASALMGSPPLAAWRAQHHRCNPTPEQIDYIIDIEQIRTTGDLLEWTLHLTETKDWLRYTNWTRTVRDITAR